MSLPRRREERDADQRAAAASAARETAKRQAHLDHEVERRRASDLERRDADRRCATAYSCHPYGESLLQL